MSFTQGHAGRTSLAALVALAGAAGPAPAEADPTSPPAAAAAPAPPAPQTVVQHYRIEDWRALSSEALLIRTNHGKWYRATLMSTCIGLQFTDTIAFVTRGERSVDRFAGIMLPDGSRCFFKTFEAIPQPPGSREPRRP